MHHDDRQAKRHTELSVDPGPCQIVLLDQVTKEKRTSVSPAGIVPRRPPTFVPSLDARLLGPGRGDSPDSWLGLTQHSRRS